MKRKNIVLLLICIAFIVFAGYKTYSYYSANLSVTVSATSSNIKCDAVIEEVNNNEKSIYGYSEFKVVVKNTENNVLSGESFDYTLTFENESGSNGVFGYNNEFDNNLTVNGSLSNDQARTNSHIIQVKSSNGLSETINYKVKLDCVQQ